MIVLTHSKQTGDATPKRYFVCYSVTTDDSKEYLYYVKFDKDAGIEELIDEVVTGGLSWLAASKLMKIFEMESYKLAEQMYLNFIASNTGK